MIPITCKACGNKIVITPDAEMISINEKEFCDNCDTIIKLLNNNMACKKPKGKRK
jgi:hypothetical protein